jgi:hypothetical protein
MNQRDKPEGEKEDLNQHELFNKGYPKGVPHNYF